MMNITIKIVLKKIG